MIYLYIAYAAAALIIGGFVVNLITDVRDARRDLDELSRRTPEG